MVVKDSDETSSSAREGILDNAWMVRAIAAGDAAAERAFVEQYLRPVRTMLLARSRDADLTADLQQNVMIEAICALRRGQLRDTEKLGAFVSGIARNQLNNHYRSSRRTESLEMPDDLPDLSRGQERVDDEQRAAQAAEAIASLDPVDRSILQMTLIEGLKPGVIAERLQMNPEVVRQRKLRATRKVIDLVRERSQSEGSHHHAAGKVL